MPLASIDFLDLITFTRSGSATYFDANGVMQTVGNNEPRFNHRFNGTSWAAAGLLIEPAATNLLVRSREFDNASWSKTNATVSANAVSAPDGTTTADKLVESASTAAQYLTQIVSMAAATAYTISVFAKAGERSILQITSSSNLAGGGTAYQNFNLATGALGGSTGGKTATITPVGGGWYRCTYTDTSISAAIGQFIIAMLGSDASRLASYAGDGSSGLYLWGAQLEAGSVATSFILTENSTQNRGADVAVITGSNFSSWFNPNEGTFVVEADMNVPVTTAVAYRYFAASDGSLNNHISGFVYNGKWGASVVAGGITYADLQASGSYTANVISKLALAYMTNNVAVSVSGAAVLTDTSVTLPTVDRLSLGSLGGLSMHGHLRSLKYWPTRLSDSQLQSLSSL